MLMRVLNKLQAQVVPQTIGPIVRTSTVIPSTLGQPDQIAYRDPRGMLGLLGTSSEPSLQLIGSGTARLEDLATMLRSLDPKLVFPDNLNGKSLD